MKTHATYKVGGYLANSCTLHMYQIGMCLDNKDCTFQ